MGKKKFVKSNSLKTIDEPNTEKIMALFVPLYKDYREESEKLVASFSTGEIGTLEIYFQGRLK